MPHSLRVRLKNLQRKGELTEKDIDRIFKALSQEPCDEVIGREDTMTALRADTSFICPGDKLNAIRIVECMPPQYIKVMK